MPAARVLYDAAIPRRPAHLIALLLALPALSGCGSGGASRGGATTATTAATLPALATRPARPGEVVVRGEASPASTGPYTLHGRYLVRFVQYAPEDPALDFAAQTPFVAALTVRPDDPRGSVKLFRKAAASGRRELKIDGHYFVEVSFGDFPYIVRFTPRS